MSTRGEIACLPEEVLREIFSYLSVRDLINTSYVCKHWRSVQNDPYVWKNSRFTCNDTLSLDDILDVLAHASLLQILRIQRRRNLETILDKVGNTCFNLHTLIIKIMEINPERYLERIACNCQKIKVLEIPHTRKDPPRNGAARVLSKFCNLRRLDIKRYELFPEGTLRLVVDGCPYLEELYFPRATVFDCDLLYLIEQRKETLRGLFINAGELTENSLCKLGELQSLRALTVYSYHEVSVRVAEHIENLNLLSLGFPFSIGLTSNIMCSLLSGENIRNVRHINVAGCCSLDDSFAKGVTLCCPSLEHLNLFTCTGITERGVECIIEGCSKLKSLNIMGLRYAPANILHLIPKCLKSLEVLRLDKIYCDKRDSEVCKFLDTIHTTFPQLQVTLGETTSENRHRRIRNSLQCNEDLYSLWSNL